MAGTITLYYMPESPPCRAVEMAAAMAGVTLNKVHLNLSKKEHLSDEHLKINPLHKVPFLMDGDLKLNESRAIMAYLVNRYAPEKETLYPRDPVKRAKVDELLQLDSNLIWASASKLLGPKIFGAKELVPADEKQFQSALKFLDDRLQEGGKKFMLGDDITLGDISLAASLSITDSLSYDISDHKNLYLYKKRLEDSITNYSQINAEAIENMKKFSESNQSKQ